jgi:hypothetical protein
MSKRKKKKGWLSGYAMNFMTQLLVGAMLWFLFYGVKRFLPKRWRLSQKKTIDAIKDLSSLFRNLPGSEFDPMHAAAQAKEVFDDFVLGKEEMDSDEVEEAWEEWLENMDVDIIDDELVSALFQETKNHAESVDCRIDTIGKFHAIEKLQYDSNGEKVVCYLMANHPSGFEVAATKVSSVFGVSKGFDSSFLSNIIFNKVGGRLAIKKPDGYAPISFTEITSEKNPDYDFPTTIGDEIWTEVSHFRKLDMQRSYLLEGPPGTGKTSFALEFSKRYGNGRVIAFDKTSFSLLESPDLRKLLSALKPEVIVIDDIDRFASVIDESTLLKILEGIKTLDNAPVFFGTANNVDNLSLAALRPGRFDEIHNFGFPRKEAREVMIRGLIEDFVPEEELSSVVETLVKATVKMTHSYIREYCLQIQFLPLEKVLKTIKTRKRYFDHTVEISPGRSRRLGRAQKLRASKSN